VVVHGLGRRSRCVLTVRDDGVLLDREGAADVFLPVTDLVGARLDQAIAGSAYEDGGLVVVLWRLGDRVLASGMRLSEPDRHPEVVAAVAALVRAPAEGAA
jgi:hypothetical protein